MITAKINNYRGVADAALSIDSICLVAGPNGSGKSSTVQALQAASTGLAVTLRDDEGNYVSKTSAGVMVRSGTAAGKITLTGPQGETEITLPAAKVKTTGTPITTTEVAAGLISPVTMPRKARTAFLIDWLKATPTKDHLQAAVAGLPLNWYIPLDGDATNPATSGNIEGSRSNVLDKLWDLITAQGWDGAAAQIKEKGAKLKGQWEAVSRQNYGSKIAANWIPEGWSDDLMGSSEQTLRSTVTDAHDAVEASIAVTAVDDAEGERLKGVAVLIDERKAALDALNAWQYDMTAINDIKKQLQEIEKKIADATDYIKRGEKKRDELPKPVQPKGMPCPCCKAQLEVAGDHLTKVDSLSEDHLAARKALIEKTQKNIDDATTQLAEFQKLRDDLAGELGTKQGKQQVAISTNITASADALRLVRESEAAMDALSKPQGDSADVEACRNLLAIHQTRLNAFVAKTRADDLAGSITLNQDLLAAVEPNGVRADVLISTFGGFNARLQEFSAVAGWPGVQIQNDYTWTWGSTPYYLLSKGEQLRVRATVQAVMAVEDGAGMIIIDDANDLDRDGRNGLIGLLKHTGIPALVGMMIDRKDQVPNLAAAGWGRSYWLEGAKAVEI
jgi:energy-coupling factor transporter ATP-binding protein EcfA2